MKYVLILALFGVTPNGDQDPIYTLRSVTMTGGFGTLAACRAAGNQAMTFASYSMSFVPLAGTRRQNSIVKYECKGDGNE